MWVGRDSPSGLPAPTPTPQPLFCCLACPHRGLALGTSLSTARPRPCAERRPDPGRALRAASSMRASASRFAEACLLVSPDCVTDVCLTGGVRAKETPPQHTLEARGFCGAGWGSPVGVCLEGPKPRVARSHQPANPGAASPCLCWRPSLTLSPSSAWSGFPGPGAFLSWEER